MTGLDYDRFRLRTFLDSLAQLGELETHADAFKLADVGRVLEGNPKAVLFRQVGTERVPLAGNVIGSRARMAHAFGVQPRELLAEVLSRLQNKPEFVEVARDEAPVQQVVSTGAEADLTKLPVHLQHGYDAGPYISAAMDFAIDRATGWTNVGLRRLMLRGRQETGIDLVAPSDLRTIFLASLGRREPLPLSIVVGGHPIDYLAATLRLPVDELGLISSLRGAPLPVVKGITNASVSRRTRNGSSRAISTPRATPNPRGLTANSWATTAGSRPIRYFASRRSPADATRCSRPWQSAGAP